MTEKILDELIEEAKQNPGWKAEQALRCAKKELLKAQEEERKRMITWLAKFCRHIDNGDRWLTDQENLEFFQGKMKRQFGWEFSEPPKEET